MTDAANSQTNVRQAVPFFGVADIDASLRFYVDGLGFKIANQWIHEGKRRWCFLQRDDAAIMLQEFWKDGLHEGAPSGKLGQGVSICFFCNDALSIYRDAAARGLKASEPFVGNTMWVVGFSDPDGYRLDFESLTDVPEETTLSEWERNDKGR
jgi:catechol 2,3-dioxygenase-like lactoylglutathione lyase family enzyme